MKTRLYNVLIPLVPAVFILCSEEPVSPPVAQDSGIDVSALIERVKPKVERIRGLSFLRPVYGAPVPRSHYLNRYVSNRDFASPEMAKAATVELFQLGLLTDTTETVDKLSEDHESSFPAAYYVPGTDSLYIIKDAGYEYYEIEIFVAHELVHALQDQNHHPFDPRIAPVPPLSLYNSDFETARICLIEGDAQFTDVLYSYKWIWQRPPGVTPLETAQWHQAALRDTSFRWFSRLTGNNFLEPIGYAPYLLGGYFVSQELVTENWSPIDKYYAPGRLPQSTAEIIRGRQSKTHYFDLNFLYSILLENRSDVSYIDDDNMGAFMLLALLKDEISRSDAQDAVGLEGDRLVYFRKNDQPLGSFVWAFTFTSRDYAEKARKGFAKVIGSRLTEMTVVDTTLPEHTRRFQEGLHNATLVQHNEQVWWIENLEGADRDTVIARLSQQYEQPVLAKSGVESSILNRIAVPGAEGKKLIQEIVLRRIRQSHVPLSSLAIK